MQIPMHTRHENGWFIVRALGVDLARTDRRGDEMKVLRCAYDILQAYLDAKQSTKHNDESAYLTMSTREPVGFGHLLGDVQ